MIPYPEIDPVAVAIGPLKIRWYGLMYLVGFAIAWFLARRRAGQPDYGADTWTHDPIAILRIWEGGMSFHGGLLGLILCIWLYGRKIGKSFFEMTDFVAPLAPLGLFCGRLGNFINGELWGKPTDVPWAFVVDGVPRHASQLYEGCLEGFVLFMILWTYSGRRPPRMAVSGTFLLFYGAFRFAVEFVRIPDAHIGYLAFGWLTMGQVLSSPMILGGVVLLLLAYRHTSDTRTG